MKQFKFLAPLTVATGMALMLFSCNSGEEKKPADTPVDSSAVKAPEPPPPPDVAVVPEPNSVFLLLAAIVAIGGTHYWKSKPR